MTKNILHLSNKLGLKVKVIDQITDPFFEKKTIYIPISIESVLNLNRFSEKIFTKEIAHELGHFLVAPKGRKYKKDYGIIPYHSLRNNDLWDLDEYKATLIQAVILRLINPKIKNYKIVISKLIRYKHLHIYSKLIKWWKEEAPLLIKQIKKLWKENE